MTEAEFTGWLHAELRALNTDENVFGEYIVGILNDDDDADDSGKREALQDILSQIVDDDDERIGTLLAAILERWSQHRPDRLANGATGGASASSPSASLDIDERLARLLETQTAVSASAVVPKQQRKALTAEELRIRDQILAQYSQVELDECADDDDGGPPPAVAAPASASSSTSAALAALSGGGGGGIVVDHDPLMQNTNVLDVQQLQKEKREQARADSKAKKDKDREDRDRQKREREEKKNARKTVKGERRR